MVRVVLRYLADVSMVGTWEGEIMSQESAREALFDAAEKAAITANNYTADSASKLLTAAADAYRAAVGSPEAGKNYVHM